MGGLFAGLASGNALLGLLAAGAWGVGDFSGGMSSKFAGATVRSTLRVARVTYSCSALLLIVAALVRHDSIPVGWPLAAAIASGMIVGFAGTAFYAALAQGAMGASAAASGLLAAAIPALFAIWVDGTPGWRRGIGFLTAATAIWLIAAGDAEHEERQTILLAVAAGAGFGVYFILMKYAGVSGILWPIAITRVAAVATCSGILLAIRGERLPAVQPGITRWVLLSTIFDTAGNLLFVAATRVGRLDVASVLAALYPAGTILLAAWRLKERPTRRQTVGMAVAAVAVVLITL